MTTGNGRTVFGAFCSVTGYKKKIVSSLAVIALFSVVLLVRSTQSSTSETSSENAKRERSSLFANDPNFLWKGDNFASTDLTSKTIIAVVVVVSLGVAAIYFSKRFLPRIANLPGKQIRIVETAHLGPRKTVHLVKIGNQRLLIGSTNENITMLADVTEALCHIDLHADGFCVPESIDDRQA